MLSELVGGRGATDHCDTCGLARQASEDMRAEMASQREADESKAAAQQAAKAV
eukprot:COSAG01_NODE_2951_length_6804_cov_32.584489_5_plen_53_part_00